MNIFWAFRGTALIIAAIVALLQTNGANADEECAALWSPCGGSNHVARNCCDGSFCHPESSWYHQCIPNSGPPPPPSAAPTNSPTTQTPSKTPTKSPTEESTNAPSKAPTKISTKAPTVGSTQTPTKSPTERPTASPTQSPTNNPSSSPTRSPTASPTQSPTNNPTSSPTRSPTSSPTTSPTKTPTSAPTTAAPTPSTCSDLQKNGFETDVDCGGRSCTRCKLGKVCAQNSDCLTGYCDVDTCDVAPTASPTYSPTKAPTAQPPTSLAPTTFTSCEALGRSSCMVEGKLCIWNGRACAIRPPLTPPPSGSPITTDKQGTDGKGGDGKRKQNEGEDSDGIGIGVIAAAGGGALVFIVFALYILQRRRSSSRGSGEFKGPPGFWNKKADFNPSNRNLQPPTFEIGGAAYADIVKPRDVVLSPCAPNVPSMTTGADVTGVSGSGSAVYRSARTSIEKALDVYDSFSETPRVLEHGAPRTAPPHSMPVTPV